jgi:TonB family protein
LLGEFDRAANNIKSGTGSATAIEEGIGSGDSGPSVATYGAWVRSVYQRAWVTPEDATTEDATVEVKVTVASDGTVTAKRIIKRSGDAAVDASVQRALDRVTTVGRPFPEGAKDKERSYIIPFNMKTKRGAA